jgi:two-component system chemotaxis response regulator CheY
VSVQLKSSIKILVVDEFTASRKALVYTLEQLGFENMEEVSDGYSALVRLKSALFDLVITDWEMSKMRGLQLLREIRADQELKHIPVLMVTEDTNLENIVDAVKAGLNAYVIKPVDVKSFSEKMNNIFY